jgi:murein DD-endopeptidase / murein LD-carboxypeptidase
MRKNLLILIILLCMAAALPCTAHGRKFSRAHKVKHHKLVYESSYKPLYPPSFGTDSVSADTLLNFAQSLIGTRYRSATSDPAIGFDCSGFVSYVFKNFNFNVPRSSCEFINVGEKIRFEDARPGDIILFTGTKKHTRKIGHVGIVLYNGSDEFKFIHSTSGKEHGVTITAMDATYRRRFVQIIRLLKTNDDLLVSQ